MVTVAGEVFPFGTATNLGNGGAGTVHIEPTPSGNGYWLINRAGQVTVKGDATGLGNATLRSGETAVSLSATPVGNGYWIFTRYRPRPALRQRRGVR